MFTGSSKKKSIKKTDDKKEKDTERFMVREDELRARYKEHRSASTDLLTVPKVRFFFCFFLNLRNLSNDEVSNVFFTVIIQIMII